MIDVLQIVVLIVFLGALLLGTVRFARWVQRWLDNRHPKFSRDTNARLETGFKWYCGYRRLGTGVTVAMFGYLAWKDMGLPMWGRWIGYLAFTTIAAYILWRLVCALDRAVKKLGDGNVSQD